VASQPTDSPGGDPGLRAQAGGEGSPIKSTGRQELLDLLKMLERGEEISEDMLTGLGWSRQKAAAFIRALKRVQAAARGSGVAGPARHLQASGRPGTEAVQAGRQMSGRISVGVAGQTAASDALGQIAPPPEQRVPPALQTLLDAYYRALAERRERAMSEPR
jgi:hypothetical protein